jgi:hypothetical protein
VTVPDWKQHEAQRGWRVLWLPLAGAVFRLSFVSGLLLLQVLQTISEATGTASAWVVHIQVARGKSTAVESGTSSHERRPGVCVRSSSHLCQCRCQW